MQAYSKGCTNWLVGQLTNWLPWLLWKAWAEVIGSQYLGLWSRVTLRGQMGRQRGVGVATLSTSSEQKPEQRGVFVKMITYLKHVVTKMQPDILWKQYEISNSKRNRVCGIQSADIVSNPVQQPCSKYHNWLAYNGTFLLILCLVDKTSCVVLLLSPMWEVKIMYLTGKATHFKN